MVPFKMKLVTTKSTHYCGKFGKVVLAIPVVWEISSMMWKELDIFSSAYE